ncbi:TNT domain-containing protein [Kitasatospora griseola]|uniref:TNT domain-containing protein n=1 Tax=Kitasatospora griseola TaxID=2064 RepID=UPI00382D5593
MGGVPPGQSGLQQYYTLTSGLTVLQLGDICYLNGYEVKNPPKGCQTIAASFDEWLLENGGELDWTAFDMASATPMPATWRIAMLLYSYCHWEPMGFNQKPYEGYCGDNLSKQLSADGGFMMVRLEQGMRRALVKPLLKSLGIGAARTTMTLEELTLLSPAYRSTLQLSTAQAEQLIAELGKLTKISNELAAAGTLGPQAVPKDLAKLTSGWERFGQLPRESFVNKYWNPRAYQDADGVWQGGWNYPVNYAKEGTKKMLSAGDVKAGTVWDRFGASSGRWFSPASENAPFAQRALPPSSLNEPYLRYKWARDYDAGAGSIEESKVAPWFEQPGGATQYKIEKSVRQLCIEGYLVFENGAPCI